MTAVGQARAPFVPPKARPWSRIYGLGTVYAKTLRDSRLAVIIVVRPRRRVPAVRWRRLRRGVQHAPIAPGAGQPRQEPAARAVGRVRQPVPRQHRDAGRVDRLEDRRLAGPDGRAVVRARAVRHARRRGPPRQPRVRRHDAARHAPDRRREAGGPPHRHGHRGHRHGPLRLPRRIRVRDPAGRRDPGLRRRSASPSGSGWWRWRPGRSRSPSARSSAAGRPRGSPARSSSPATSSTATRRPSPHSRGVANLTWWGWTAHHQPLAGQFDWVSLVPAAIVAIVLFVVGVELFARRDLGLTSRVPWPGIPAALIGLRGPTQPLAGRAPAAGGVVGDRDRPDGLHLRGGVAVADRRRRRTCRPTRRRSTATCSRTSSSTAPARSSSWRSSRSG